MILHLMHAWCQCIHPWLLSVCSMPDAGWLTPSPPGVAAFPARSARGVKFIKRSVELFNMKVSLSVLCGSLMWHLIPSAAALLIFTALPWIPALQKGQHFPSKSIPTAWLGKGSKSPGRVGAPAQTNCLPSPGWEGHPGSSAPCRWWQFKEEYKLFLSCIKATVPGW